MSFVPPSARAASLREPVVIEAVQPYTHGFERLRELIKQNDLGAALLRDINRLSKPQPRTRGDLVTLAGLADRMVKLCSSLGADGENRKRVMTALQPDVDAQHVLFRDIIKAHFALSSPHLANKLYLLEYVANSATTQHGNTLADARREWGKCVNTFKELETLPQFFDDVHVERWLPVPLARDWKKQEDVTQEELDAIHMIRLLSRNSAFIQELRDIKARTATDQAEAQQQETVKALVQLALRIDAEIDHKWIDIKSDRILIQLCKVANIDVVVPARSLAQALQDLQPPTMAETTAVTPQAQPEALQAQSVMPAFVEAIEVAPAAPAPAVRRGFAHRLVHATRSAFGRGAETSSVSSAHKPPDKKTLQAFVDKAFTQLYAPDGDKHRAKLQNELDALRASKQCPDNLTVLFRAGLGQHEALAVWELVFNHTTNPDEARQIKESIGSFDQQPLNDAVRALFKEYSSPQKRITAIAKALEVTPQVATQLYGRMLQRCGTVAGEFHEALPGRQTCATLLKALALANPIAVPSAKRNGKERIVTMSR